METEPFSTGRTTACSAGAQQPPPGPGAAQDVELCRIVRWQGYASSTFFAQSDDEPLFESRAFRWRRAAPPPDEGAARAAYDELVARLVADGWERHEDGPAWYATSFIRAIPLAVIATQEVTSPAHPPDTARIAVGPEKPQGGIVGRRDEEVPPQPEPRHTAGRRPNLYAQDGEHRRGRRRLRLVVSAGGAALAVGIPLCLTLADSHVPTAASALPAAAAVEHSQHRPAALATRRDRSIATVPPRAPRATPSSVDVRIVAHGNGSWIDARRGSASGKLLYSGLLTAGRRLHFRGRLWTRLGAAGNLSITANGKPVPLRGTYDKLFLASSH